MDFQYAETAYKKLRDLLAANKISQQEFSNQVKSLVVREESGFIWQIRETDGSWMRWNGSLWEQVPPPHRAPSPYQKTAIEEPIQPPAKPDKKEPTGDEKPAPETLLQLLKLILRQLLKRLPI